MRRIALMLGLFLGAGAFGQAGPTTARDAETFEAVSARLSSYRTVRGEFTQTREVAALSRPLVSRGRFIVSDLGMYWQQTEPFASLLIATEEALIQKIADRPAVTISAAEQPLALSISRVFLNIFRGYGTGLGEHFDVEFESAGQSWSMTLEPTTFPLTEAVRTVAVEGGEHLERLRVDGVAGDVLTIELSNHDTSPATLSDEERELYVP